MPRRKPTVSEVLRRAIRAGPGIRELAREAGVDPGQISRFVRSERGLTDSTIDRLAFALNLELRNRE